MFFFTRLNWLIPESARKKHCYIVAGSGSGKSELIKVLILSYLKKAKRAETVFLLDPHGDIAEQVAQFKEHQNPESLIYLSPNLEHGFYPCINPLEMGQGRDDPQKVNYMAECLTDVFKEIVGADASITANMETLLKAVLSVLLQRENSTLLDLQQFMRDSENAELVEYAITHSNAGQQHFFNNAFYDSNYTPTKKALYTKLQSLFNSHTFFSLTIGKSTLDIKQAMDSKKTVVFNLSKGILGGQTSKAIGRFIVALVQGFSFERQTVPEKQRIPVYLFLDEFQNFITPSIETILAESRKYAVHLTLAQQFFGQGTENQLKGAILNNTAVKIAGTGEGASLEAIQKFMNGISKEDLQNLQTGHFYVRAKTSGIIASVLSENQAQKLKTTTAYLKNSNQMSPKKWQRVKTYQKERYYRQENAKNPTKNDFLEPDDTNYPEAENNAQNAKYKARTRKPLTPKFEL